MATTNPGPEFVKELPDKYKCSICTNLLDTPVLTECCGQHFCKDCLEKWTAKKKTTICPHCRAENFNKIIAKPTIRKINKLQVYCTNSKDGCKDILCFGTIQEHVDNCPFGYVACTNGCDTQLLRKDLQQHCQEECTNRIVNCSLCNLEGKHCNIVGDHVEECPELSIECPNECGEKVKRKDFEQHKEEECPLEVVDCPFKEAGCEEILLREYLPYHEMTAMQNHLKMTMSTMITANKENGHKLNTILSVVSEELSKLKSRDTPPQPIESIRTTLTSLSTMIQPDGQLHTVHVSDKLGVCTDDSFKYMITASSPLLCIHPGYKIYIVVLLKQSICVLQMKSKIYGYPDNLSILVQFITSPPIPDSSISIGNSLSCVKEETEYRILFGNTFKQSHTLDINDFYVKVNFRQKV